VARNEDLLSSSAHRSSRAAELEVLAETLSRSIPDGARAIDAATQH
jgi:hypothetical protein